MKTPINRYPKVRVRVAFIDPQKAQELLGTNSEKQRKINKANLAKIVNEMSHDRFQLNGESIIVGTSGKVLNGQHRLLASVNAEHGFWTVLVEGVDDELFYSIDVGKSRSLRDVLFINKERNISVLATSLVRLSEFLADPSLIGSEMVVSNGEALDVLAAHPKIRQSVDFISSQSGLRRIIAPSRLAWLHYLATDHNQVMAESFFQGLITGAMLPTSSPIYVLRSRLSAEMSMDRRLLVRDVMALLIKGWNAFVNGQQLKALRIMPGEVFPRIIFSPEKARIGAVA